MKRKGILLFSGGLDSLLAAKVLMDQGIELIAVNFVLPFEYPDKNNAESFVAQSAAQIGLHVRFIRVGMDYIKMLLDPPHGYGKNINPCIDCKISFLRNAKDIMLKEGAAFIATGEVNGQRPMSQRKDMIRHIEKASELEGYILRPLSATFFEPTIAEKEGIVDRSRLLHLHGRGRKIQIELAEKYNIQNYSTPAGGCLFTEPHYSNKAKDLLKYQKDNLSEHDFYCLRIGRHFRINDNYKLIVTRDVEESKLMIKYHDGLTPYGVPVFRGPYVFVSGTRPESADFQLMADIAARYGKPENDGSYPFEIEHAGENKIFYGSPVNDVFLDSLRI